MRRIAIFIILIFVARCAPSTDAENNLVAKKNKIIIYQTITRLFGNQLTNNKPYGTIEENGVGKFNDITNKALDSLKTLGITHVWYTGVIEHALLTDYTQYGIPLDDADVVKGRAGSPYSIKDYYDVNPDLAVDVNSRMTEFEAMIKRTHDRGLKAIIDFVPNHVARRYKSDAKPDGVVDLGEQDNTAVRFSPKNNFYYLPGEDFVAPQHYNALGADNTFPTKDRKFEEHPAKVTGNDKFTASPSVDDWFESAKLNYGVDIENEKKTYFDPIPDTWIKMRDILLYWTSKGVDGFRCDMAEMVPVEFWNWVIPQIKQSNPNIIFIAEIYNPQAYRDYIHKGGFDFLYDKVQLYDTLRLLINGKSKTTAIPEIQHSLEGINDYMLHFLENHDEQRIASRFFAGDPWKAIPAMVISATIDKGPVMIFFGQEVGEPGDGFTGFKGDEGRTTHFDYWGVVEHQKWMNGGEFDGAFLNDNQKSLRAFYKRLLNVAQTSTAIVNGEYADLTQSNVAIQNIDNDVFACARWHGEEVVLVVAGFNPEKKNITIAIPDDIAEQMGLNKSVSYNGTDLLNNKNQVSLSLLKIELEIEPYDAHIFKLNK